MGIFRCPKRGKKISVVKTSERANRMQRHVAFSLRLKKFFVTLLSLREPIFAQKKRSAT